MTEQTNFNNLWQSALVDIEKSISSANYKTWFKETFISKHDDGIVYVGVPNAFVRDWLSKKFHKTILKSLRNLSEHIRGVEYSVIKIEKAKNINIVQQKNPSLSGELPLSEYYINKEDNLNPRYTFENFVVGPFNELAYAASQAIIKKPGIVYNPLFVYGNTGHGKTHLIQAIGNYIKTHLKDKKIYYLTSEQFAQEYITSVQSNKVNQFKDKYRKYDVLIMDDIQFLSNKEKTQEELFHLFNSLYGNNKQIVFSSDKHPNYINNLEERLKSRFNQGMIVDIPKPDHESRVAILEAKLLKNDTRLSKEVVDYLAQSIEGNIREIEGAVNSIICQTQLKNKILSFNEVKDIIKNNTKPKRMVSVSELVEVVANFYNIEKDSIFDKTRKKEVIRPRQVAMYILREDFNISYPTIGDKLGGRDHTTVIHSCEKIKVDIKNDPSLTQQLTQIRALL
jgi:chromosomal replication initiator protein